MKNPVHTNLTDLLNAEYQVQLKKCAKASSIKDWKAISSELLELSRNLIQTAKFDANSTIRLRNVNLQYYSSIEDFNEQYDSSANDNEGADCASPISDLALSKLHNDGLAVAGRYNISKKDCDFIVVIDTVASELENLLDLYFQFILGREPDEFGAKSLLSACKKENEGSPFWLLGAIGRSIEADIEGVQWLLNDKPGELIKKTARAGV